jgi:hypothetical protein
MKDKPILQGDNPGFIILLFIITNFTIQLKETGYAMD